MMTREEAKDFELTYGIKIEKELQLKNSALYKRDYLADMRDSKRNIDDLEYFELLRKKNNDKRTSIITSSTKFKLF